MARGYTRASNEITVVFCGKCGAGKTTLITNILKITDTEVITPKLKLSAKPVTDACQAYTTEARNGTILKLVDTVGLISGKNMKKQLREIVKYTNNETDLLVYCLPVGPESKFVDGNPAMMKAIRDVFGKDIWKRCLLILTFSDLVWYKMIKKSKNDVDGAVVPYQQHLRQYTGLFKDQLKTLGVKGVEVHTIFDNPLREGDCPTIVAIPASEDNDDEILPGIPVDETGKLMGIIVREMIRSCRVKEQFQRRAQFQEDTDDWLETLIMVVGCCCLIVFTNLH